MQMRDSQGLRRDIGAHQRVVRMGERRRTGLSTDDRTQRRAFEPGDCILVRNRVMLPTRMGNGAQEADGLFGIALGERAAEDGRDR